MSRKAWKVVVELTFRAVSCPGVHLTAKDDIYLSMCFMGQYCHSECIPAVFPLLFHEKMTFDKIFRHAVDPGDVAVMLEYETVRVELVQLIPPVGDTLACFEEDAWRFLFPEPKLVPSFSGVDREVLMTRAPHFPGIAPRLEFSTKTTIIECSADTELNIDSNVLMRPVVGRNRKHASRSRSSTPQNKGSQTLGRRLGGRACRKRDSSNRSLSQVPRAQPLSPLRAGHTQQLSQLSLDSAVPRRVNWDTTSSSQPMLALWPGASRSASPHRSAVFTHSSSPLTTASSSVGYSQTGRRKSLSNSLVGEKSEGSSSSQTQGDDHQGPEPSTLWPSFRFQSSSHREWKEVQERVRGLLATPKAVLRLAYGATHSEVDQVLARRSISPGPP